MMPKTPVPVKRGLRDITNDIPQPQKTPPFCSCGRRSKYLIVSKPGPNRGRRFYACPQTSSGKKCKFFKWDSSDLGQSPAFKPPMPKKSMYESSIRLEL